MEATRVTHHAPIRLGSDGEKLRRGTAPRIESRAPCPPIPTPPAYFADHLKIVVLNGGNVRLRL
jgi:hypothetical protein